MINSRAGISWLTLLFVAYCGSGRAQDTLKNVSSSTGLAQYCGSSHVVVSENQTINYEVLADARAIVKSQEGITLKPGFKAGEFSNEGFFLAKIVNACGEMVWTGVESSDWNEPKNWESYGVPGANDEVVVQASPNEPVYDGGNGIVKALVIQGSDLVVNSDLQIAESLELTSGVIRSENGTIELLDNSTVTGGDSDSYIQGYVSKSGASSFVFPLGDKGFYRPLTLETPMASGIYRATYRERNSDGFYSHDFKEAGISEISTTGYWEFYKESGPEVAVSIGYDQLHSCGITGTDDIEVTVWDGTMWTSQGVVSFTGDENNGVVTSSELLSYGPVALTVSQASGEVIAYSGEDKIILQGQSVSLGESPYADGGQPPYMYRWVRDGLTVSTDANYVFEPENSGEYFLEVRDAKGCYADQETDVVVKPTLTIDFSTLGRTLLGDDLIIRVVSNLFDETILGDVATFNFELSDLEGDIIVELSSASVPEVSKFNVSVDGDGVIQSVSLVDTDDQGNEVDNLNLNDDYATLGLGEVRFQPNGSKEAPKIPNQFTSTLYQGILLTPDGDGNNDVFGFVWDDKPSSLSITVYDLKGQQLFHTSSVNQYWDGKVEGATVPVGHYNYSVSVDGQSIDGQFMVNY